jgi:hypothetical protein
MDPMQVINQWNWSEQYQKYYFLTVGNNGKIIFF